MKWIEETNKENDTQSNIMSFNDYMDLFQRHPLRESRPTCKYLLDMINYFGNNEKDEQKIYLIEDAECPPVFGENKPEKAIFQNIKNFLKGGFNNKFILLIGPNGSSKSSIVKKLMKGTETYSLTEEGALFTFSWIFPIETYIKGSLGLTSTEKSHDINSYAYLEDKDINAILNSELKDHPILLIPLKHRQRLFEDLLKDDPEYLEFIKKSYLYQGDLSKRNRMIYDALLKSYKGNHQDVLKHIRVEQFNISRRYSNGAVSIEPQMHVDAHVQQITMDKRLASLPPSLQSLNLFSLQGENIMANRGILEYTDLLKRPIDTYKYLLQTMETININLQGILTQLDIFFIGTSNEIHFAGFKQHPDFNSFKGRFNFIKVPYLLNYLEEEKIYLEQVEGLKENCFFEPHSLKVLCLFAAMTRFRACQSRNYEDKKLGEIVSNLNPLQKALFISDQILPNNLNSESQQILKNNFDLIESEYESDSLYEGKFGMSPREIKNIIYKLSSKNKNITFIEILEYLEKLSNKKNEYDFLNMTPQGDFHHPIRFIALLKTQAIDTFDQELRDSLGLVDERSYEDYIKRYITNINAIIKNEKIKSDITGKFEEPDNFFVSEFEANIKISEKPETFRSHIIAKLGAYSLDNPGQKIVYGAVLPDLVQSLQESFRIEQKKVIDNISTNLVFYEAELNGIKDATTQLSDKNRQQIKSVLDNLQDKYKYSLNGAITILKFVIKEKY